MKLSVHYDPTGKIRSFVAVEGRRDSGMMLVSKAGTLVAEVEDVTLESGVEGLKKLRDLAKNYLVEKPAVSRKLVKRERSSV